MSLWTHTGHRLYRFSPPLEPDFPQLLVLDRVCDVGNLDIECSDGKIVVSRFFGGVEGGAPEGKDIRMMEFGSGRRTARAHR